MRRVLMGLPLLPGLLASMGLVASTFWLAVSNEVLSAIVAGIFSLLNTTLLVVLTVWRRQDRSRNRERDVREIARDDRVRERDESKDANDAAS